MYILIIIALIILIGYIVLYNAIINTKNSVEEAKSSIDVMLKNRCDIVPNLINAVKGYMKHEKDLLNKITQARTGVLEQSTLDKEKMDNDNILQNGIKSLFAVAENYPDLKANQNFLQLQDELVELENKIQAARRGYNYAIKQLNNKKEMFPSNLVAGFITLPNYVMFEASEQEKQVVQVNFDTDSQ